MWVTQCLECTWAISEYCDWWTSPSALNWIQSFDTARSMTTSSAAWASIVLGVDMVLEISGHFIEPPQCIPIPSRLFWTEPSVNVTGKKGSRVVAFLIASSRLAITTGAATIHGALQNASIFFHWWQVQIFNLLAMRCRGEIYLLLLRYMVRLIFQKRWVWWFGMPFDPC